MSNRLDRQKRIAGPQCPETTEVFIDHKNLAHSVLAQERRDMGVSLPKMEEFAHHVHARIDCKSRRSGGEAIGEVLETIGIPQA